jgi:hypothetical protein
LIFLALFFFPIALYCLILGMINRRAHPVMVSGCWDFLGLLLAASGLLLFGGPTVLAIYYDRDVRDFLLGKYRSVEIQFTTLFLKWWMFWLLYYVVVLGGGAFLIWLRRSMTSIYNVDPLTLDDTLGQVLVRMDVEWTRMGNRVFIGFRDRTRQGLVPLSHALSPPIHAPIMPDPSPQKGELRDVDALRSDQEAVLDIEPFYSTRHVTLNWKSASGSVRQHVEAELAQVLEEVQTRDNPTGTWLMIIASSLFALIVFGVALSILVHLRMHRPL